APDGACAETGSRASESCPANPSGGTETVTIPAASTTVCHASAANASSGGASAKPASSAAAPTSSSGGMKSGSAAAARSVLSLRAACFHGCVLTAPLRSATHGSATDACQPNGSSGLSEGQT